MSATRMAGLYSDTRIRPPARRLVTNPSGAMVCAGHFERL